MIAHPTKCARHIWPNITGTLGPMLTGTGWDGNMSASGVLSYGHTAHAAADTRNSYTSGTIKIDASRVSAILGLSSTIQPSSYRGFNLIKF